MSYPYSSGGQPSYPYTATAYSTTVPQYTQTQINVYYQQYQCYPAQPFQIIPDAYPHPVPQIVVPASSQSANMSYPHYGGSEAGGSTQENRLAPLTIPQDEERRQRQSQKADRRRSRSTSRTRSWACDHPQCTSTANFTRLADLQRHQSTVHGHGVPDYPCTVPRCNRVGDKGFTRRDHLVEHLRNFHHLDIPKRRPGERSANPLGRLPGSGSGSGYGSG